MLMFNYKHELCFFYSRWKRDQNDLITNWREKVLISLAEIDNDIFIDIILWFFTSLKSIFYYFSTISSLSYTEEICEYTKESQEKSNIIFLFALYCTDLISRI